MRVSSWRIGVATVDARGGRSGLAYETSGCGCCSHEETNVTVAQMREIVREWREAADKLEAKLNEIEAAKGGG